MTTLAEHIIVAGAENHPPMLEKSMYDSWASRIREFIKGKKHGRLMLDSIDNGTLIYLTVEENGQTRPKKYSELTEAQQLQDDYDVQATNISSTSKFVTNVKLAKSLYTTSYDQLYAYLSQHERHANEESIMRERYPDPLALVANSQTLYNPSQSPQHSVPTMHPLPQKFTPVYGAPIHHQQHHTPQGDDPIERINKAMAFLSTMASRQSQSFASTGNRGIATTLRGNYAAGQPRVVKCYNCQGEGHMARQCTQPKRPRNNAWCKKKLMLAEAHEAGQILNDEQLAFLADPGISEAPVAQQTIP
ncbi:retrovirus-related pol polyprotein from transposon TNT 1-94 [Tanacetum coccineum]|uniref:Retrovirus-related pol polyprotein from transposon TNT 1-94 n=1 Tax=Tanacetum coccineum TaxID=301880 RepID=A0ABQ5EWR0_9ASTR